MTEIAKTIIFIGLLLVIVGVVLFLLGKIPGVGKLPGDIVVKKDSFSFYFPITTCIILSIIISILFQIFGKR